MTEEAEQRDLLQAIDQRPAGSRVLCIGVGNEVNRPILDQLAQKAGGISDFISQGDDFERAAAAFRRKLMWPAATNVEFRFEGVEVYDLEPGKLPDLFHGAPLRLYGRYKKGGDRYPHLQRRCTRPTGQAECRAAVAGRNRWQS